MQHNSLAIERDEREWLSEIVAIQRDIAHTHNDSQKAMDIIVARTRMLTGAESSVIEMLDGDEMVYCSASGVAEGHIGLRLNAASSLSGLCVKQNMVLKCDDAMADDRVDKQACIKIGILSMVVVPLTREKKAVGVLKVLSSQKAAFDEAHVTALELMAGVLSAALSDALTTESLRQNAALFRAVMEHSPIGMALVEPDGTWFKVNTSLCTMLGRTEHEMLSMNYREVSHPDDIEQSVIHKQSMERDGNDYAYEKRYLHKNGQVIIASVHVSPLFRADGSLHYVIAQIQDITERKQIEKLKSEFISTVSHELRTPLTAIHGALGLVASGITGDLPEQAAATIHIAHRNSDRLVRIINDILDLEKIEAGYLDIAIERIELKSFLESALLAHEAYGQKFGVTFVLETMPPAFIMADAGRCMQVMANLLSNAAKFSKPGDTIHIRAFAMGASMRIEVEDSGPGVPQAFQKQLFNKFVQADGSDTRQHNGTGLGLNIAKQLVELMNGSIGFRTDPGKGTVFHFDLPMAMQSSSAQTTTY